MRQALPGAGVWSGRRRDCEPSNRDYALKTPGWLRRTAGGLILPASLPDALGMDIGAVAAATSQSQVQAQASLAATVKSRDVVKQQGEAAVALMQQAMELQKAMTQSAAARGGVDVVA